MTTNLEPMGTATEAQLIRFARALENLAAKHGLSNLHLAGDGQLIADIPSGRTLLDVARFELEAQVVLQARVFAISSRAPIAEQLDRGPLTAAPAA